MPARSRLGRSGSRGGAGLLEGRAFSYGPRGLIAETRSDESHRQGASGAFDPQGVWRELDGRLMAA